jgi:diguanylate cyclase (GGDEF)-like protein/PAS domain S-box-containing protein
MNNQGAGNLLKSIWDSLTIPDSSITEQTKRWQARLTTITILVIFAGVSLNIMIDGGLQPFLLLPIFLGYLLSRTKYYRLASFVILATLLIAILFSVLKDDDFHKYAIFSNMAWLTLSLLLASLLFTILETVIIALAHIAILLLMVWFVPEMDFRSVGVTTGFLFMFSALLIATMWQRNWLETIRQQEIRMQATALESSDYAVMILNKQREIIWVNPAFNKLTGFTLEDIYSHELPFLNDPHPDQILADQIWTTLYQGQTWQGTVDNYKKSGQQYDESMIITPVTTEKGDISHFVAIKHDITEQIAGEERLKFLATHDLLTSLPNRGLLHDRLSRAIARANRTQQIGAVLYLDLDNFKHINDAYSHEEGDQVLRILAQRMQALTREADTVARIPGDEFVILMEDVEDSKNVSLLTERILYEISKPIQLQHTQAIITASIGISLFPMDGQDNDSLLQNADVAMYYGKSKGKNSYVFFTEAMKKDTLIRVSLGSNLRKALSQSEFMLEYQPLIDLHSNQIIGAEALIRWQHPEHGKIYPGDFIPLAEENNLMLPIGEWVFKQALDLFQDNHHPQLSELQLSINLLADNCVTTYILKLSQP